MKGFQKIKVCTRIATRIHEIRAHLVVRDEAVQLGGRCVCLSSGTEKMDRGLNTWGNLICLIFYLWIDPDPHC